jgi:hypothetical protein
MAVDGAEQARRELRKLRDWERELRRFTVKGDLPPGYEKSTLLAVAWVISTHGSNGKRCFPSLVKLASELELDKKTVVKYRQALTGMGWFTMVGKQGRSDVLDISVPSLAQIVAWTTRAASGEVDGLANAA